MIKRLRVLAVEDNPADADLIREYLADSGLIGFQLDTVSCLSEAIARLERESFDLLLIDLGLPDSQGLDTFYNLRKATPKTPTIILTGYDNEEAAITAVQNGAQDYLIKGEIVGNLLIRAVQYAIERKRVEAVLHEREAKLRTLFELLPVGVSILDTDHKLSYFNPALERILGISKESLSRGDYKNRTYLRSDGTPMPAEELASARVIKEQNEIHDIEIGVVKEDGAVVWTNVSAVPVTFSDWKIIVSTTDITEHKRIEDELRENKAQLSTALQMARAGHWEYDVDKDLFTFNENFFRIFRTSVAEMGGCQMSSADYAARFCHPDDAALVGEETRAAIESTDPDYNRQIEHRILYADGEVGYIAVRFSIIKNALGRTVKTRGVNQDITLHKRAEEKLRETLDALSRSFAGTIQALAATTEMRDPYTAGHQKRVADLARAIGREMGLAAERVEELHTAGLVHDIGKVSLPAEIMSKPAGLTVIEHEMIKSHSRVGHDILDEIDFAWPLAEIVLQHHERMNGSGYPRGLTGDDILLEARILAVSDVVAAMTSHRPYRSSLGIERALEEIDKNKGILYDPDVAAACLTLFRNKGFTLKHTSGDRVKSASPKTDLNPPGDDR